MANGHDELRQPEHVHAPEGSGDGHQHGNHDGEHHVHVIQFWPMFWCFIALVALTFLTVWTANIHYIGSYPITANAHLLLALGIASVKTVLVAGYFMHLFYDKLINTAIVVACLFAVALFIGISAVDVASRGQTSNFDTVEVVPGGSEQTMQKAIDAYRQKKHDAKKDDAHAGEGEPAEPTDAAPEQTPEPEVPEGDTDS